jgi:predicted dehydrogenase
VQNGESAAGLRSYTQLPQPIRIGVIGVGNMGQHHTRVLSRLKQVELVGVSDVSVERGIETASRYRTRYFENYVDLLQEVDAVCIAVPTRLHHAIGLTALKAGVHVLIEKPIAATITEAESLVNAAAAARCILQVGHIERFNPVFQSLSTVLQTETALALEAHRMSPHSDRANDVSVVLDLMIHDIDLMLELTGSNVVRLTASGNRASAGPGKSEDEQSESGKSGQLDYVTATLGFANGQVATLTASKITHRKIRKISAHCRQSLVEADFLGQEVLIHRSAQVPPIGGQYRQEGLIEQVSTLNVEPLQAELEHFVSCVRGGHTPSIGGEQALKALRIASLIEQMALDGKVWQPAELEQPLETPVMSISA